MADQKTLTVTLETVTPLFLGGAEPRGEPELRVPAFRGALRYWLRAALGGVIGDQSLSALHQLESAVFGSPEYGSPINLRLPNTANNLLKGKEKILPHREGREAGLRDAFRSGQKFTLYVQQLRSTDSEIWQVAVAALQLTLTFGGIGLRSRRGYGTLRVVDSSDHALVTPFPSSFEGWLQHVTRVTTTAIAAARALAESRGTATASLLEKSARYPCATKRGLVRICQMEAKSAPEAVTQFMQKVPKSQALGDIKPRQASPLWVRPIQCNTQQYGLLLAVLASQFNGANYDTVQSFLDKEFPGEEVSVKGWNA